MKILSYYDADGKYLFCGTEGGKPDQPHAGIYEGYVAIGRQYHDLATNKPVNMPPQPSAAHEFDYKRKTWVADTASLWALARAERDKRIAASDWVMLADVSMSAERKQAWLTYRQALRDITNQADPTSIAWPKVPS